ncbi:transcriptional regulator Spx [Bacillus andreraoultii]|uniref:transcriptional regulator Spx n=1 Tax=Bacillus andreraoultii TaxID=1499685 RepID=UPI00053A0195|nr:transcriptional regulator Spx [Bacillus andreraoultii]
MITFYSLPSCASCRKSKKWLMKHEVPFTERNILSDPLNESEIKHLLKMTTDGTEEIISTKSKVYQALNVDIEQMNLNNLISLIMEYPKLLKAPILFDERYLQVGHNEEGLCKFLPRRNKKRILPLQALPQ